MNDCRALLSPLHRQKLNKTECKAVTMMKGQIFAQTIVGDLLINIIKGSCKPTRECRRK